jgi:catechol 2,3-dioxygenase-like lactoylglutathione lyase family enzyme
VGGWVFGAALDSKERHGEKGDRVTPTIDQTIPIFRIFDVEKAKEFYCGYLGFAVDWEHRFDPGAPLYMQVSLGGLRIHLSEHHGNACPGSTVFVRARGLAEYHRELGAKQYRFLRPGLDDTGHGSCGLEVTDPFGNRIRFDEPTPAEPSRG